MPLRLHASIATPISGTFRWGIDEHAAENVPTNVSFSTAMPGGFEQCSVTLPRKTQLDYPDLGGFSTLTIYGATGDVAWEGRIETMPRTSGDHIAVTPGAVGWQAHLDDDKAACAVYVDTDQTRWQAPSVQRKISFLNQLADLDGPSSNTDPIMGQPSVVTALTGAWDRQHCCEAWYDAKGIPLASLYYAWQLQATGAIGDDTSTDTHWSWLAFLASDDVASSFDVTAELRAAGPGSGFINASGTAKTWAAVHLNYDIAGAGGSQGVTYPVFWPCLAVYGNHGLTRRGTAGFYADSDGVSRWHALGFYASDIVGHALATWAPRLATSRAGVSTIESTTFVIPQAAFLDPTTASEIIKTVLQYELLDWWVDEGPTFNLASPTNHGKRWRARIGQSQLQETGPQVDRMWSGVVVSYRDVSGVSRTVGPTGSGTTTEDASLSDPDPSNPVNVAGLTRRAVLQMNITSTPPVAIRVGQAFLQQQKLLNTSGQAILTGHVEDDHGVTWPAWKVRAGDQISFVDAHDSSYRRIVKTDYNDATKANTIQLDSPPEGLQALLERMSVSLMPLGFS